MQRSTSAEATRQELRREQERIAREGLVKILEARGGDWNQRSKMAANERSALDDKISKEVLKEIGGLGWTMAQVGQAIGQSRQSVQAVLNGDTRIVLSRFVAILEALDLTLAVIPKNMRVSRAFLEEARSLGYKINAEEDT